MNDACLASDPVDCYYIAALWQNAQDWTPARLDVETMDQCTATTSR